LKYSNPTSLPQDVVWLKKVILYPKTPPTFPKSRKTWQSYGFNTHRLRPASVTRDMNINFSSGVSVDFTWNVLLLQCLSAAPPNLQGIPQCIEKKKRGGQKLFVRWTQKQGVDTDETQVTCSMLATFCSASNFAV
jgi:hypothetical protein